MDGKQARIISIIAGVWLFISAFVWPHSEPQFVNTWIIGAATAIVAAIGRAVPSIRYVNTALAAWLFISAWALQTNSPGTTWNNVIVAVVIFVASLTGTSLGGRITPSGTTRTA